MTCKYPAPQVIGTLPWVVNPPGIATASPAPAPSLQVQAVTPQLLLNAQGHVIATLASGTIQAAAGKKSGPPETPTKSEVSAGHGERREHPWGLDRPGPTEPPHRGGLGWGHCCPICPW